ncbi:hypothetical protein EYF80_062395 [Liparis tanakae]|uniref:Uncharacterized protein n=1 Tax=Liparis tanakae TaxID=230148 RepID=A0A4Z2EFJ1_9TELE|nr:hypothetical protein EYF80_062395 [Liparis tanakae]
MLQQLLLVLQGQKLLLLLQEEAPTTGQAALQRASLVPQCHRTTRQRTRGDGREEGDWSV